MIDRINELENLVETISRGKMAWQSTFDVITDPVMIIDNDYNVTRANKALAEVRGHDVRTIIGKKCYEVLAGYSEPCPRCPVKKTLEDHQPHSAELQPFPSGHHYYVNTYSMSEESSARQEFVLHYRNITEEKELHKRLFQSEKMAAVGTLAGGIAHEINNPLGAILAFTQLVLEEIDTDHPSAKDLQEIEAATKRCRRIVKDLLNFSRQSYDEKPTPVDLNDVISKSMAMVEINTKNTPVDITVEKASQLPKVQGHFHKLQQVLLNLVSNAVDAMKDSGGKVVISTGVDGQQGAVLLTVRDTGPGISDDIQTKIFDPYFTTKGQGEGTGLGLSITYKIVQEHKGSIDLDSELGSGTEFSISFPIFKEKA